MADDKKKVPLIQRMISSGGSAIVTKTLVTPFDVVKTYLQVIYWINPLNIGGIYDPREKTVDWCIEFG